MILTGYNRSNRRKTSPSATLSAMNPTFSGLRIEPRPPLVVLLRERRICSRIGG
jgi:hypothetical protein